MCVCVCVCACVWVWVCAYMCAYWFSELVSHCWNRTECKSAVLRTWTHVPLVHPAIFIHTFIRTWIQKQRHDMLRTYACTVARAKTCTILSPMKCLPYCTCLCPRLSFAHLAGCCGAPSVGQELTVLKQEEHGCATFVPSTAPCLTVCHQLVLQLAHHIHFLYKIAQGLASGHVEHINCGSFHNCFQHLQALCSSSWDRVHFKHLAKPPLQGLNKGTVLKKGSSIHCTTAAQGMSLLVLQLWI